MQSVFEDLYSKKILEEEFGYTCFLQTLIDNRIPYKKTRIPSNMILLTEDTINTKVYFIEKGIVSLEKNKNVISFLGSNQIAGLNDYFMAEANLYTARVIETITAYEFDKEDIILDLSQYLGHILVETAKTFSLFLNLQTPVELSNESNYGFDYDYKILQCS